MNFDQAVSSEDWEKLALDKLKSALHLGQIRQHVDAYLLAGTAVECALKCRIMRNLRLNCWPSREHRPDLYTHNLLKLLRLAGLEDRILAEQAKASDIGIAWSIVNDWEVGARYAKKVHVRDARDILQAIGPGDGLVRWILEV